MDCMKVKKEVIKKIFENMEYGEITENFTQFEDWVKKLNESSKKIGRELTIVTGKHSVTIEIKTVDDIMKDSSAVLIWNNVDKFQRCSILTKLSQDILKKSVMFEQIEMVIRGILSRETKEAVNFMNETFSFYSNLTPGLDEKCKPSGFAVISITNECSLIALSLALASTLASGHSIILQAEDKISLLCQLLMEICASAGIPNGAINLLSEKESLWGNKNIDIWIEFCKKLDNAKSLPANTKYLSISKGKIPFIVFNNADLDSACEALIKGVWSFQGMLPWSVDKVLVQEDVFDKFVQKLKKAMNDIKMGEASDKMADFSYPVDPNAAGKLNVAISAANQRGIEVFKCSNGADGDNAKFAPTLFVGGNCFDTNSFLENDAVPCITATAFRTVGEAVNLANNTPHGFAASVWTENASLAQQVAQKLQVGIVWVNDHGYFSPEYTFCPQKCSGVGLFGGIASSNLNPINKEVVNVKQRSADENLVSDQSMAAAFESARKGFESWNKVKAAARVERLKAFAEKLSACDANAELKAAWKNAIFSAITRPQALVPNFTRNPAGKRAEMLQEAIGVVLIDCPNLNDASVLRKAFDALVQGDSVIVRSRVLNADCAALCKTLTSTVPDVLTVVRLLDDDGEKATTKIVGLKDAQSYFSYCAQNGAQKSVAVADSSVAKVKLVWTV